MCKCPGDHGNASVCAKVLILFMCFHLKLPGGHKAHSQGIHFTYDGHESAALKISSTIVFRRDKRSSELAFESVVPSRRAGFSCKERIVFL